MSEVPLQRVSCRQQWTRHVTRYGQGAPCRRSLESAYSGILLMHPPMTLPLAYASRLLGGSEGGGCCLMSEEPLYEKCMYM